MSADDDNKPPYTIESETRVRLGPVAREMARMHNMTETELARHLLQQEKLRKSGLGQKQGEN
jgi:hypothetical protein